ncbi:MAG TPA: preprotein translocase subunit SecG [Fluviicoccus sp.]|nr:preprotein translocase subunit SecG [Fluviicoccus sp.]
MEQFILILHVLIAIAMTFFILMQQGKGAEMGASFGAGSSQTVFGSAGSAGFLTKATGVLALAFFVTSITLAFFAKKKVEQPIAPVVAPVVEKAPVPANPDVPASAASQPVAPQAVAPAVPAAPAVNVAPVAMNPAPVEAAVKPVKVAPAKKAAPVESTPAPVEAPAPVVVPAAPVVESPAEASAGTGNP